MKKNARTSGEMLQVRIRWTLENVFGGSQRRMAEALGMSQPTISRILGGQQQPGTRFVDALANHQGMNPTWLYTGEGEPLLPLSQAPPAGGLTLPVALRILPGLPEQSPLGMSGYYFPVAHAHYRPTRYYLLDPEEAAPAEMSRSGGVLAGDMILMESEVRVWQEDPLLLDGMVCAVRLLSPGGSQYVLSVASAQTAKNEKYEMMFAPLGQVDAPVAKYPFRKRSRAIEIHHESRPEKTRKDPETHPAVETAPPRDGWESVTLSDVVAIGILLVRNWIPDRTANRP